MEPVKPINTQTESLNLDGINYYSTADPEIEELVLAKFTSQADAFFGELVEFTGYRCIMNYQDVVKKRKVASWAKFVPMNKTLVVQIEDVDVEKKIVQTSMAHLVYNFKEDLTVNKLQDKLMESFNENKMLEGFIKSLCIVNNLDIKHIWTTLIYHVDNLRRQSFEHDDNETISLGKYFYENFKDIDEWIGECDQLDESFGDIIKDLYKKRTKETAKKISSRIGVISLGGVTATKELFAQVLSQVKHPYTLRYDTAPYYLFESSTEDSDTSSHTQLIKNLENESSKIVPKIFVKTDFVAKISVN
jgi:translation initiation factor 2 alpha subunit (eIF-2alpha)